MAQSESSARRRSNTRSYQNLQSYPAEKLVEEIFLLSEEKELNQIWKDTVFSYLDRRASCSDLWQRKDLLLLPKDRLVECVHTLRTQLEASYAEKCGARVAENRPGRPSHSDVLQSTKAAWIRANKQRQNRKTSLKHRPRGVRPLANDPSATNRAILPLSNQLRNSRDTSVIQVQKELRNVDHTFTTQEDESAPQGNGHLRASATEVTSQSESSLRQMREEARGNILKEVEEINRAKLDQQKAQHECEMQEMRGRVFVAEQNAQDATSRFIQTQQDLDAANINLSFSQQEQRKIGEQLRQTQQELEVVSTDLKNAQQGAQELQTKLMHIQHAQSDSAKQLEQLQKEREDFENKFEGAQNQLKELQTSQKEIIEKLRKSQQELSDTQNSDKQNLLQLCEDLEKEKDAHQKTKAKLSSTLSELTNTSNELMEAQQAIVHFTSEPQQTSWSLNNTSNDGPNQQSCQWPISAPTNCDPMDTTNSFPLLDSTSKEEDDMFRLFTYSENDNTATVMNDYAGNSDEVIYSESFPMDFGVGETL